MGKRDKPGQGSKRLFSENWSWGLGLDSFFECARCVDACSRVTIDYDTYRMDDLDFFLGGGGRSMKETGSEPSYGCPSINR